MTDVRISDMTDAPGGAAAGDRLEISRPGPNATYRVTAAQLRALYPTFLPETYGAVGDGVANDTAAVQAAVNAAAGRGRVVLSRSYRLDLGGTTPLGVYPSVGYGVWVNSPNIYIEGPGRLVLAARPAGLAAGQAYAMLLFGDGVVANPGLRNVGCWGVTFDSTAVSLSDRQAMSIAVGGGHLVFARTQEWYCVGNRCLNGYGFDGVILGNSSSYNGLIQGNYVEGALNIGIWLDGSVNNRCVANLVRNSQKAAIACNANLDNNIPADCTVISNNVLEDWALNGTTGTPAISLQGAFRCVVEGNVLRCGPAVATGNVGIAVRSYGLASVAKTEANDNLIVGNLFHRETFAGSAIAVLIEGSNANPFDGTALPARRNVLQGNVVTSGWALGVDCQAQAENTVILANSFNAAGFGWREQGTASGTTPRANVFGPSSTQSAGIACAVPLFGDINGVALTNQGAAETELNGNDRYRARVDLSQYRQIRIAVRVFAPGAASAQLRLQYSIDNDATWAYFDTATNGPFVAINANGTRAGAWATIPAAARGDVSIRCVAVGGDGVADPAINNVMVQLR